MPVNRLDHTNNNTHRWRVRGRAVSFGALALTLSAVLLLAAACGGESAARVATPAQAPEVEADALEGEPEHTHGLGDDDGHTHEDGTEHTHDGESAEEGDESAEEGEVVPDVPGDDAASTTTTTVPVVNENGGHSIVDGDGIFSVVDENGKVVAVLPDLEDGQKLASRYGPQGQVLEGAVTETNTHEHSTPDGTFEHEHPPQFADPDSHRYENYRVFYFDDPSGEYTQDVSLSRSTFVSSFIEYPDGSKLSCPEREDKSLRRTVEVLIDLEGNGCVLLVE